MTSHGRRDSDGSIDPRKSAYVLIGVHAYADLRPLPSVQHNLNRFLEVLRDPEIWGVPPARIRKVTNPGSPPELVDPIEEMAEEAEDTLFVYYSGHGLLSPEDDQLYLTLTGTRENAPHSAVPFEWVRNAIRHNGSCRRRVVILDCCYSGSALPGLSAGDLGLQVAASVGDVQGSYLMTSAAANRRALAPARNRCTAFTGELLSVIQEGIADAPGMLSLNDIYGAVRRRLIARDYPEPQEQDQNQVGTLSVVRNRALLDPEPHPSESAPRRRPAVRRALIVSSVVGAFGAGLLLPSGLSWWEARDPDKAVGPCSSNATLLDHSDALNKQDVQGELFADISGLALAEGSRGLALADNAPGRVFPVDLGPPERLRPVVETGRTLRSAADRTDTRTDGEALVLEQGGQTMLVASEAGPAIRRYRVDNGLQVGDPLPIPRELRTRPEGEAQAGRTIEALAVTPDGKFLFAGMEGPLGPDGDARGRNLLRIQRYKGSPGGHYVPDRQYAYQTGEGLHLVELAAIDEDRLIALERQFVRGLGNASRVYDVRLSGAPDVAELDSLHGRPADVFVSSSLLLDLSNCPEGDPGQVDEYGYQANSLLGNVESMALGEPWRTGPHQGRRPLYLMSDDNENVEQVTRLYSFALRLP